MFSIFWPKICRSFSLPENMTPLSSAVLLRPVKLESPTRGKRCRVHGAHTVDFGVIGTGYYIISSVNSYRCSLTMLQSNL